MPMMKVLRRLFFVMLMLALPFNAAMAGVARLQEALAAKPIPSEHQAPAFHEHRGFFGSVSLHLHVAADAAKAECGKPCSLFKELPFHEYSPPQASWSITKWPVSEPLYPNDHALAPPEHPPKSRA